MNDERLARLAELAEAGLSAATLVHEARQPLFAIKAMAQLARGEGLGPDRLEELLELVAHLETLLEAWSDVGRREPERLFDVHEVVGQVSRMLAGRVADARATLTLEGHGPVWAFGTPSVPRQVLLNLLQNACDAVMDSSGAREVRVRVQAVQGAFRIEVEDSGTGVHPDIASRVFEPFVTSKPAGRGSGLGLYVARRLCVQAGGALALEDLPTGTLAVAQFAWSEDGGPRKNAK